MLIPVSVIVLEIIILEGILLYLFYDNKDKCIGRLSGQLFFSLLFPLGVYVLLYLTGDSVESDRILTRYAFSFTLFALITIFGSILRDLRKP